MNEENNGCGVNVTKIKYETEEDFQKMHVNLLEALYRYRFWTKYEAIHGGFDARRMVYKWGSYCDKLLTFYGFTDHMNTRSVSVLAENTTKEPPPK